MRRLVKRKQKVAARNSKFLQAELNCLKDAQHSISVCHLLVLKTGKRKWAPIISAQGRLSEIRSLSLLQMQNHRKNHKPTC